MKKNGIKRKVLIIILFFISGILLLLSCTPPGNILTGEFGPTISFPDENLERVIRDKINKPTGDIYLNEVKLIKELDAESEGIEDITGLEKLSSLEYLNLESNNIKLITGIENLSSLEYLNLKYNDLFNISPLSHMTSLKTLLLCLLFSGGSIDINAIYGLTGLETLHLTADLSDISFLSDFTLLKELDLSSNWYIVDISCLSGLNELEYLNLLQNQVADIEPLVNNEGLASGDIVDLRNNNLSVDSKDKHITALRSRGVNVVY